MSRVFAYTRVSTPEQTTDNQVEEIRTAGFAVQPRRIMREVISGSVRAFQRPVFERLVDRLEEGDVLVVTKLDRLGRNAMDVSATVDKLTELGVRVHCLQLGGVDLASSTGKLTMQVLNAVAEFERDLLIERTNAGLDRARKSGKQIGRPHALSEDDRKKVREALAVGTPVAKLAREFGTSRQTIMRLRQKVVEGGADAVSGLRKP